MKQTFHNKVRIIILTFFSFCLLSNIAEAQNQLNQAKNGFQPKLLKVEVSTNMLNPGDEINITAWWQNVGSDFAKEPLECFLEMELGNQRKLEITERYKKINWNPIPGPSQWNPSEIHAVSYHFKFPSMWGGTYKLFLGMQGENMFPIDVLGENGQPLKRIQIGEVDLGWGWGMAVMELARKPWSKEFNKPIKEVVVKKEHKTNVTEIGKNIVVGFNSSLPQITSIRDGEQNHKGYPLLPEIVFRNYPNDQVLHSYTKGVSVTYISTKMGNDSISYLGSVSYNKQKVASFELRCKVIDRTLVFTLGKTWEAPDYELLEIKLFSLFSNSRKDAQIVSFLGGGRLIPLEVAEPIGYESNYDSRNAVAIFDSKTMTVLESTCLDDRLFTLVDQTRTEKSAVIGATLVNKVRGKFKVHSIPVPNVHRITIDFLGNEWGKPSWTSIAKFMRKDLKGRAQDFYSHAILAGVYVNQGPEPLPWQVTDDAPYGIKRLNMGMNFKKILEALKGYSNLLDGYKQITQMYGWFKVQDDDGSIIGWPAAGFGTDRRGGTIDELKAVLKEAPKYNAYLHFYENYDDFFYSKYNDSTIVAIDEEGKPFKGWFWADGLSYIIAPYKYMQTGKMQERIKKMVNMYDMKYCTHLDVLTSEVLRYDFDPQYPASAELSYRGKLGIIDEYNKYGIEVASETLVHPYVGHIGFGLHTRMNPRDIYFHGEKFIPLITAVYNGTIPHAGGGTSKKDMMQGLIRGSIFGYGLEDKIDYGPVKWCYLQAMPMNELSYEKMEDFKEDNGDYTITYTNNSYIRVNTKKQTYEIAYKGNIIGKDWTTFVPGVKTGSYLAYSLDGGQMAYKAPEGWNDNSMIKAIALTADGEGQEVPCKIQNGQLIIDMPAETPVRITLKTLSDNRAPIGK